MSGPVTITPDQHEGLVARIKDALVKAGHVTENSGLAAAEIALQVVLVGAGGAFADL